MQPDGDVHGPGDQVSPTLKVAKSAQEPRRSKQFPKLPPSLSRWSQQALVSDYEWTFAHHPRCRIFPTLEAAVEAIMAGAQGARLGLA